MGVLVQTNFGGMLTVCGVPLGRELDDQQSEKDVTAGQGGSCMIIVATDAPLSDRNLERLARRSFLALGRVGSSMSNGSGDYAIAFSTHPGCRISHRADRVQEMPSLGNEFMDPLFLAVVEATEEAIYNSMFMAGDMEGFRGRKTEALPIGSVLRILDRHGVERFVE